MQRQASDSKPWVIAHRGNSSAAPENTLAAFRSALDVGADMVEMDVHLSADGHVIVMHDESVTRTTQGQGRLRDMSWPQIQQLDAGRWFNPRFTGEPVPALDEALRLLAGKAGACIEIKHEDPRLAMEVMRLLDQNGMRERSLIISFIEKPLLLCRGQPNRPRLSLLGTQIDMIDRACAAGLDGVQPQFEIVDQHFVERAHHAGLFVAVWTVNDPVILRRMIDQGVDGITTDHPGQLLDLLDRRNRSSHGSSKPATTKKGTLHGNESEYRLG